MTLKDPKEPGYFDDAFAFVERIQHDIVECFDGGSFVVSAGYYEESVDPDEPRYLDIVIAPKVFQMLGGPDDGTEIFEPFTVSVNELQNLLEPSSEDGAIEVNYKPGELRVHGQWQFKFGHKDEPEWQITFVVKDQPTPCDEADCRVHYYDKWRKDGGKRARDV